ncbi:MAG: ATP-dependent Clp protease ATP-binding subunit [Mesorhizobium sp.]|nr:MAG: ATP-dependent Clp protease ATP-binding subunit [Mesorhizobium sp.]
MESAGNYPKPRWLRDLGRFLPLKSQFVLTGNIRDLQTHELGGIVTATPLNTVLGAALSESGYADVLYYDPIGGFRVLERPDGAASDAAPVFNSLGLTAVNGAAAAGPDLLAATLERLVHRDGPPIALIADFASRLIIRNDALSPAEHQLFTRALVLSQTARARPLGPNRAPLFNTVVWILDKEGDLPDWLTIDNPRLRHIPVSNPDRGARRALAPSLVRSLPGAREAAADILRAAESDLVDNTEGLLLMDLNAIAQLARSEGVAVGDIGDAVRRYKVGVTDDAWRKIERGKIRAAASFVTRRVIGQDHAVTHMLDIVKRAATGVGGTRRGGRPRGVAFLAGPTGVGKTELAKTITELLFGDETAYIRFDMSEFSAEHADQRLIGAPPGYVGYDVGGELTNAIREKPFAVVLFDEIEKAHPRILDKFLQILDDGVLTSGRGDRVYFSEALIVFTSNLGIYTTDGAGGRIANVTPDQPYEEVQAKVRDEIDAHFKLVLNRPEILNRIGENIIVFDFIRPAVAEQIFDGMIANVLKDAATSGYQVSIAAEARQALRELCVADLSNGGRGVRNKIEAHLINPLARALFDVESKGPFVIRSLSAGAITTLLIEDGL